jgi:hypothetical protein
MSEASGPHCDVCGEVYYACTCPCEACGEEGGAFEPCESCGEVGADDEDDVDPDCTPCGDCGEVLTECICDALRTPL